MNLAISIIVYAEIWDGIIGSTDRQQRLPGFEEFLAEVDVLGLDGEIAERFASLRVDLRSRGQLIPDHDTWIAATAISRNLVLLTRDQHFDRIASLRRS